VGEAGVHTHVTRTPNPHSRAVKHTFGFFECEKRLLWNQCSAQKRREAVESDNNDDQDIKNNGFI